MIGYLLSTRRRSTASPNQNIAFFYPDHCSPGFDPNSCVFGRFVTGDWGAGDEGGEGGMANGRGGGSGDDDDVVYGDFEDLQTG